MTKNSFVAEVTFNQLTDISKGNNLLNESFEQFEGHGLNATQLFQSSNQLQLLNNHLCQDSILFF